MLTPGFAFISIFSFLKKNTAEIPYEKTACHTRLCQNPLLAEGLFKSGGQNIQVNIHNYLENKR